MVLIITYHINTVTLCQNVSNSVCLPVCGRIASATAILRSVIILKNDASMPSCRVIKASNEILQLRYQQRRCR